MLIVGLVHDSEEAKEFERITKCWIVAKRIQLISKRARLKEVTDHCNLKQKARTN